MFPFFELCTMQIIILFPLIVEMFSNFGFDPDLFQLNRFMTIVQRYTTIAFTDHFHLQFTQHKVRKNTK